MKQFFPRFVLLVAISLFFASRAFGIDGTPVWFPSVVASPTVDEQFRKPTLAFDHYGGASVVWSKIANTQIGTVYRSERLGIGGWAHRQVASGIGVGSSTTLSFDRAERPLVGWTVSTGQIHCDFNDGQVVQMVGSNSNNIRPDIQFHHDIAGNLRGLYSTQGDGGTGIAFSGSTFTTQSQFSIAAIDEIREIDITTDHTGLSYAIARVRQNNADETVAIASETTFPGAWPITNIVTTDGIGGVSIATDPTDGRIAFAYSTFDDNTNTSKVFYSKFNGLTLDTIELLSAGDRFYGDLDLAFDPSDGRPSLALEESLFTGADRLLFVYDNGSPNWQTSLVDDSILAGDLNNMLRPSLAYDDFGSTYPAISYIDGDGSLIVSFDPPVPEPATVTGLLVIGMLSLRRRR